MRYLLTHGDALAEFARRGGGKATHLAQMSQRGIRVPPWFCVAVDAFDAFVDRHQLQPALNADRHLNRLADFAEDVVSLFLSFPLPDDVEADVTAQLSAMQLEDSLLAVRSSGIDEDSTGHSFAGQFSSFLCQRGDAAISESIRRCWASGFSERAIAYRVERGLSVSGIRVGVVIQMMVEPVAAGVAFSRDPVHPLDRAHLAIDAVFGLGEGLVSGELDADHFLIDRQTLRIDQRTVADKRTAVRYGPGGGVVRAPLDSRTSTQPSISDEQARRVATEVLALEHALGLPQDTEWVIDRQGQLYIVQTRPVSTLPLDTFFDAAVNGREATLWDNSNIIESYSGVTSPLTFSFANAAYRRVYIQFCEVMGVPRREIAAHDAMYRNMLGLVRGHVYYNLINWYRLIHMLPLAGHSRGFMETMMGVKQELSPELAALFEVVQDPPAYSIPRRLWVGARTAWRVARIGAIVRAFHARFDRVYDEARSQRFDEMPLPALAAYYQRVDDEVLANWRAPIINDYVCMFFFGLLKTLTSRWVVTGADGTSLQNDLLCGQGGLESTEPTKRLMRIAQWVDGQDDGFKRWLDDTPAHEAWRQMRDERRSPDLKQRIDRYLDEYGFRCVNELKLEEKDLHDDPTFIVSAIRTYVRAKTFDITALEAREAQIRDTAEATVDRRLDVGRKILYDFVLRRARTAVRNRENLRFARTKIFGIARRLFLAMGARLALLGVIGDQRDVFFLTVEELLGYIEGRPTALDLAALVALRKKEFAAYRRAAPPPERFVTYGAAGASFALPQVLADADLLRAHAGNASDPNVLVGTPCCPGVVEAVVRVAETSRDAEGIDREILVTARTDPGWVPLYPSCAGLLIERGSLLSHSAVVARELGLPTIVGISGGLMRRLKTGQRVRMDAGKGEIRILS
ncbi:MAG: PEP-utilizing enzyme [Acidobacteriota bacterium]|nr:PEP-utilizing enzyme [Acidobacteriota bacterium]